MRTTHRKDRKKFKINDLTKQPEELVESDSSTEWIRVKLVI